MSATDHRSPIDAIKKIQILNGATRQPANNDIHSIVVPAIEHRTSESYRYLIDSNVERRHPQVQVHVLMSNTYR